MQQKFIFESKPFSTLTDNDNSITEFLCREASI